MTYDETNRPDCKKECGRKAALSKGELAYKGFCSRCYKEDVDARRRAREEGRGGGQAAPARVPAGDGGRGDGRLEGQGGDGDAGGGRPEPAGGGAAAGDEEPGPEPEAPRQSRPRVCGWCNDGNHWEREEEPVPEGDLILGRRARPATRGCVGRQRFLSGPMAGELKGIDCSCPVCGGSAAEPAAGETTGP